MFKQAYREISQKQNTHSFILKLLTIILQITEPNRTSVTLNDCLFGTQEGATLNTSGWSCHLYHSRKKLSSTTMQRLAESHPDEWPDAAEKPGGDVRLVVDDVLLLVVADFVVVLLVGFVVGLVVGLGVVLLVGFVVGLVVGLGVGLAVVRLVVALLLLGVLRARFAGPGSKNTSRDSRWMLSPFSRLPSPLELE